MQQTGAVISGSAALLLLHDVEFTPCDLDFYVAARGFASVLSFVQKFGYEIDSPDIASGQYDSLQLIVIKLVHRVSKKSINVVTNLKGHVVGMITQFHSTLVMNYIAFYGVVSLYPYWTLRREGLMIQDTWSTRACFAKYKNRGFRITKYMSELAKSLPEHDCTKDPYCPIYI